MYIEIIDKIKIIIIIDNVKYTLIDNVGELLISRKGTKNLITRPLSATQIALLK